jgi:hypothetical protein
MNSSLMKSYLWITQILQSPAQPIQTILRVFGAVLGGYALTYSTLAALALLLPWHRLDVVFFSALFPGILWLGSLLWAFAAPTAQRACRDLFGAAAFFGILALVASRVH